MASRLTEIAHHVVVRLRAKFPGTDLRHGQMFCVGEEAGEAIGAYRRWSGMARRRGEFKDVRLELADVVISAYCAANVLGFDLDEAIEEKTTVIFTRPFKDWGANADGSQ